MKEYRKFILLILITATANVVCMWVAHTYFSRNLARQMWNRFQVMNDARP